MKLEVQSTAQYTIYYYRFECECNWSLRFWGFDIKKWSNSKHQYRLKCRQCGKKHLINTGDLKG